MRSIENRALRKDCVAIVKQSTSPVRIRQFVKALCGDVRSAGFVDRVCDLAITLDVMRIEGLFTIDAQGWRMLKGIDSKHGSPNLGHPTQL